MKSQKGITLIMLVITIIVLIIITSVTVYTGTGVIKRANLQTLNTNMLLLQAKIKTIAEESRFNKNESNLKGKKLSEITDNNKITQLINENIIENAEQYYLLSQEDLNSMGLEKVKVEEGYLVNYDTEEVIYLKGFEANGGTYYKLSETRKLNIK